MANADFQWLGRRRRLFTVDRMNEQNRLQKKAIDDASAHFEEQGRRRIWVYRAKLLDVLSAV